MAWALRRISVDVKPASWFEANEKNFRTHPKSQGESFKSVAKAVGWAGAVSVNLRDTPEWETLRGQPVVLDGHMRVIEALKEGDETPVPVDFYNFTPKEEELILLTLDYIGKLAGVDRMNLSSLMDGVMENLDALEKDEHLEGLLQMMARENNIFLDKLEEVDLSDIDDLIDEHESKKKKKAKLIVTCDPARVEEIGNFLNSVTGCEWIRKE